MGLAFNSRKRRLEWCRERQSWTAGDWQHIVFSDEFNFCFGAHDVRVRVRRRVGESINIIYIAEQHTAPSSGVME